MKFKMPWKASSLLVIFLIAIVLFSPSRVQSLLGIRGIFFAFLDLSLLVFGVFNFLVMFNQEVVSEAAFREYYGWIMYIVYWLANIAVFLLVILVTTGERFLRFMV